MLAELSDVELMSLWEREPSRLAEIFGEVFTRYYDQILRYLYKRTGDKDLAEDMAGTVFTKALDKIDSFDNKRGRISTWLYAIAGNELKMEWRRRGEGGERRPVSLDAQLEQGFEPMAMAEDVGDTYDQGVLADTFRQLLGTLSAREREVIWLFYFEEMSTAEIAEVAQIKPGAVRTALSRGREHLEPLLLRSAPMREITKKYYE